MVCRSFNPRRSSVGTRERSPETPEVRLLGGRNLDDLESKLGGFGLEVFYLQLAVLGFVELRSLVHVESCTTSDAEVQPLANCARLVSE